MWRHGWTSVQGLIACNYLAYALQEQQKTLHEYSTLANSNRHHHYVDEDEGLSRLSDASSSNGAPVGKLRLITDWPPAQECSLPRSRSSC